MKRLFSVLAALVIITTSSGFAQSAPFKTHVAEFTVSGTATPPELRQTLQGILASRLDTLQVQLVEKPEQAELLISGSYARFGTMFSMDVAIKSSGTDNSLSKVFEQGEGDGDIIPAVGRLARKIDAELAKRPSAASAATPPAAVAAAATPAAVPAPSRTAVQDSYIVRTEPLAKDAPGNWSSAPLDGIFTSIASGRILPGGERELYISGGQTIRAYRKGSDLKLIAEITIPRPARILAIDTADLDRDGLPELYVTIIDRAMPASRVYQFDGTNFISLAEKLPWLFRAIGPDVSSRIVYIQELDNDGRYYGQVRELARSGNSFSATRALKLPDSGNIFNFNLMSKTGAADVFVTLNEDGYLVASSADGSEAWKSSEKYGGSEMFFNDEPRPHIRSTADLQRWTFLEQRMTRTKDGTLIVPHNEGTFSFGNNRTFDKHTLFAFEWTGAVLKEKWHTRTTPGYLADYAYDQTSPDIILLEVVQKSGMFSKGKTVISINRIE